MSFCFYVFDTYVHSLGLSQCPFFKLHPTEHRAVKETEKKKVVIKICVFKMFTLHLKIFIFFFLANIHRLPISDFRQYGDEKKNSAFSFLKIAFKILCLLHSTDAKQRRRSNSGITHCGNKYQKRFYFGAGFECRVVIFALFFSSFVFMSLHIQQMDFDRFFSSHFEGKVKLDNICSSS